MRFGPVACVLVVAVAACLHRQNPIEPVERPGRPAPVVAPVALTHAMIIEGPASAELHGGTLVLRDGRVAVVQGPEVAIPDDIPRVDLGGGWVTPSGLALAAPLPGGVLPQDRPAATALRPGAPADVLVWSHDPRAGRAQVERAYVGGRLVLERPLGRHAW